MNTKDKFTETLKQRTKKFAVEIILFRETLKNQIANYVITYQRITPTTLTGANYQSACQRLSNAGFFS